MKLYIDTNTYLSNLNATNTDNLKALEKLKRLINEKKVELILPSQTKNEYLKHFKERIDTAKKRLNIKPTIFNLPNELKSKNKNECIKEEKVVIEQIELLNIQLKQLAEKRVAESKKHLEAVDKIIKDLFKIAINLEHNDHIVLRAIIRQAKGLPPKKDNFKFGDAIIWETLKDYIKNESLVIISYDRDFDEVAKKGKPEINKILKNEWKKSTKQNITLYPLLGQFVNAIEKEDPVSREAIEKEAIQTTTYYASSPNIIFTQPNNGLIIRAEDLMTRNLLGNIDTSGRLIIPITNNSTLFNTTLTSGLSVRENQYVIPNKEEYSIFSPTTQVKYSTLASKYDLINPTFLKTTKTCSKCKKIYEYQPGSNPITNLCRDCYLTPFSV